VDARRPFRTAPARVSIKPLVRLAVRVMGPGPQRLRMVKLLHELDDPAGFQPLRKAA
jgi:hypothetical protein